MVPKTPLIKTDTLVSGSVGRKPCLRREPGEQRFDVEHAETFALVVQARPELHAADQRRPQLHGIVLPFPRLFAAVRQRKGQCPGNVGCRHARACYGGAGLMIVAGGIRTVLRVPDWRDNESLALHDVLVHPESAKLQAGG